VLSVIEDRRRRAPVTSELWLALDRSDLCSMASINSSAKPPDTCAKLVVPNRIVFTPLAHPNCFKARLRGESCRTGGPSRTSISNEEGGSSSPLLDAKT